MAYSSTTVSAGTGAGIVVAVGKDTEIGGINQLMTDVEPATTPLLRQMDRLSTMISVVILVVDDRQLVEMLDCFKICNDSELVRDETLHWRVRGEPTEGALLAVWQKAGIVDPPRDEAIDAVEECQGAGITVKMITDDNFSTIVFAQMFHLFNNRSLRRSAFCCDFYSNKAVFVVSAIMVVLQLAITYLPFMNEIFGTRPLPARDWLYPFILGLAVFFIVEGEKWVMRQWDKRKERAEHVWQKAHRTPHTRTMQG